MELAEFCHIIGWDERVESNLSPYWVILTAPAAAPVPDFVNLELFKTYRADLHLPPDCADLVAHLETVCARTAQTPALQLFFQIYYRAVFIHRPALNVPYPADLPLLGEDSGAAWLLLALSAIPGMIANCRQRGIPERYAIQALPWIGGAVKIYQQAHGGISGFSAQQLSWLAYHLEGRLYRIGRFEFLMHTPREWLPAIYRCDNGDIAVLCHSGQRLNAQGLPLHSDQPDSAAQLITSLVESRGKIAGTPINPEGFAQLDQRLTLDLSRWHPAYTPWDLVPSVHIPGGEPLHWDDALNSFREARDFFRRFFQREVPLFTCSSWILNPYIEQVRPNSNLAQFQRELYLFPSYETLGVTGLFFVSGSNDPALLTQPSTNHGVKMLQDIIAQGGQLLSEGMFVLTDHLEELGGQFYRNRKFALSQPTP